MTRRASPESPLRRSTRVRGGRALLFATMVLASSCGGAAESELEVGGNLIEVSRFQPNGERVAFCAEGQFTLAAGDALMDIKLTPSDDRCIAELWLHDAESGPRVYKSFERALDEAVDLSKPELRFVRHQREWALVMLYEVMMQAVPVGEVTQVRASCTEQDCVLRSDESDWSRDQAGSGASAI